MSQTIFVTKDRMGAFGIINLYPLLYPFLRMYKAFELLSIKQLISQSTMIALHMAIIKRLSRGYYFYPPFFYHFLKLLRAEDRSISESSRTDISSKDSWRAIEGEKEVEMMGNCASSQKKSAGGSNPRRVNTSRTLKIRNVLPEVMRSCRKYQAGCLKGIAFIISDSSRSSLEIWWKKEVPERSNLLQRIDSGA